MLDALFASAPVGLALLDRDLRYLRINQALAELNGRSREEHVGRTMEEMLPAVADVVVPAFRRVIETGEPLLQWEVEAETAAAPGEKRLFVENVYPLEDEAGEVRGLGAIVVEVTDRRRAAEARRAAELHRAVIAHMAAAQEEERKRIALDVHDDVLQAVTAVGSRLDELQRDNPEASAQVAEIREALRLAVRRLRHLVFTLRPPALDLGGLTHAIELYLSEQRSEWGLEYTFDADVQRDPPEGTRVLMYRIAQEAITNVRRHASADLVQVSLKNKNAGVELAITDDGTGLEPAPADQDDARHFGLAIMRERAEQAGGWWRIESDPGSGTTVRCWLPSRD